MRGTVDQLKTKEFLKDFIEGLEHLSELGENADCIKNIRNAKNLEAPFRDWFSTWFEARGYKMVREALIGNKRIDLKISHTSIWKKIIEFKGWWWESNRKTVIQQTLNYLTEFEGEGYIFIINHKKENIVEQYKVIITEQETEYKADSWEEFPFGTSAFLYYRTVHLKNGKPKEIYHLIYTAA